MNYEFASPGPVNGDIRIPGGTVNVDAGESDKITVSIEPFDGSEASRETVEQTRVALEGNQLVIHSPAVKNWAVFRWPKLNVRVTLPQESTLTIKTASAEVTCNGVYQDMVVYTASGDVVIDRVVQDVSVNSGSGEVRLNWAGGNVHANTASGDITIQHAGKNVDIISASGDVEVVRADGDVRGKTASGDVKVGVAHTGEVRVHTASGDLSVGVAAGTGVWLDLSTASGRTTSDLDTAGGGQQPETSAGLKIKARTASGDITIRRAAPVHT